MGLYDYYVKEGYNDFYKSCAKELCEAAKRNTEYSYIFETMAALSTVLSEKAELGVKITNAYKKDDKDILKYIAEEVIPRIIENIDVYHQLFEKQWNTESKIFGYEIMDIRFGSLVCRLTSAKQRILQYVSGSLQSLPELEVERLPFDSHNTETTVLSANWRNIISSC